MIVCCIDIETTGLDFVEDEIIEIAWIIKKIGDPKPLSMVSHFCILPLGKKVPEEITELTKITDYHCEEGGLEFQTCMYALYNQLNDFRVDYIAAHNGNNFDRPFLEEKVRVFEHEPLKLWPGQYHWIDTMKDIKFPKDCKSRNLTYLAGYHGFVNPFPHAALFDVACTLKLLEMYDVEKVVEYGKQPSIIVRAMVDYHDRDLAKEKAFRWQEAGGKTFTKCWVKEIKEGEFEELQDECKFDIVQIDQK